MRSACLPRHPAVAYLFLVRPMTVLLGLLLTGVVFALASAISGIQSIYTDHTGTVITYWHGYGRLLALAYAALLRSVVRECSGFHFSGLAVAFASAVRLGRGNSRHSLHVFRCAVLGELVAQAERLVYWTWRRTGLTNR